MVRSCVAFGCNETYKKGNGIQFHKFPVTRPKLLMLWENAVQRKNWKATIHSTLCSRHFDEDAYQVRPGALVKLLKEDAVPTIFFLKTNKPQRKLSSAEASETSSTCGMMGPKTKRKISKGKISQEGRKKNIALARKEQKQKRARLVVGDVKQDQKERSSVDAGSQEAFKDMSEEAPVEIEIKEECCFDGENGITQEVEPESEVLPGPKGQKLYYDGAGYYYTQLYEDLTYRWLQCSHGECKVMAKMKMQDKSAIHIVDQSSQHDHPANPARRHRIMFLHTVKTRHANEATPFSVIFQQEACKNPVGASFFSFDKIQAHLQKKISLGGSDNLTQKSVLDAASKLSLITMDRPSIETEPPAKKMRIDNTSPLLEKQPKKLERLEALKEVTITEKNDSSSSLPSKPSLSSRPSESVPVPSHNSHLFHDNLGNSYKHLYTSGNSRYLLCNFSGCLATAEMGLEENAPISLQEGSPAHNHISLSEHYKVALVSPVKQTVKIRPVVDMEKINQILAKDAQNTETAKIQTAVVVLNKVVETQQKKNFEKLEGPEYYYDFRGFYYFTTKMYYDKKYLRCLYPTCPAQAMLMMTLEGEAEIQPINGSCPHNHPAERSDDYRNKIKQWEDEWSDCLPSERLPSLRVQHCCYHDGKGFYYYQTSRNDNIRQLVCAEPKCQVRAHMNTLKDAPIMPSGLRTGHSHGPDHTLRDALLFIDAVRVRTRNSCSPANAISLEASRNPVGASRVDLQKLGKALEQAIKLYQYKSKVDIVEDEVDYSSCIKAQKKNTTRPPIELHVPVPNHHTSPIPILNGIEEKNKKKEDIKPELVPALLSDSWLYHDGCGYYYNTISFTNGCRQLQCAVPKCGVRAVAVGPGGSVKLRKPHSHGPQPAHHRHELWFFHNIKIRAQKNPDMPIGQIYNEVFEEDPKGAALVSKAEVLQLMYKYLISIVKDNGISMKISIPEHSNVEAEELPTTIGYPQYHDGHGYYYTFDNHVKKNTLFSKCLKCSYRTGCPATAILESGKVKTTVNTRHNHDPDLVHREMCFFSMALKRRVRDEETPLSDIYKEEAERYPEAAAVLQEEQIKEKLANIRRYVKREVYVQDEEEDLENNQNSINQARPFVASEVFVVKGKDVYHDGRGYFYHETFSTNQMRYLMCCEPHCLAQAKMGLMTGSPVMLQTGSCYHNHDPDPLRRNFLKLMQNVWQRACQSIHKSNTIYQQETAKEPIVAAQIPKGYLYKILANPNLSENNDDEMWMFSETAEKFPSEHGWIYHNNGGYFYYCHHIDKSETRILKCCEENCEAMVRLEGGLRLVRAPGSLLHNHKPQPRHLAMLLLLHRVATRMQFENASVTKIYKEELLRDPDGSALVQKNKLNEILQNLTARKYFKVLEEEVLSQKEDNSEDTFRDDQILVKLCEVLTSAVSDQPVYHDREGHYYTDLQTTNDRQYFKCVIPACRSRGYMEFSKPLLLHIPKSWKDHNHKADPNYRDRLLFVNKVKKRAINENTPINVIYKEESKNEPVGAEQVNEASVKKLMYHLRKSKDIGDNIDIFPFTDFIGPASADEISDNINEPAVRRQENIVENPKGNVSHRNNQTEKQSIYQIKASIAAEEGNDEYTEEEYLEEERLENESIMTNDPTQKKSYSSIEAIEADMPSEKLPTRLNTFVYHDGRGYYFQISSIRNNNMFVMKCSEQTCSVQGQMQSGKQDAPITLTGKCLTHNHKPDFERRKHLLFAKRCKERAAAEVDVPIKDIWASERKRDPESAANVNGKSLRKQMLRYRIKHAPNLGNSIGSAVKDPSHSSMEIEKAQENLSDGKMRSEALPGQGSNTVIYHDLKGYYYSYNALNQNKRYLCCIEPKCSVRGSMPLYKGAPIRISYAEHNHQPDFLHKNFLLFMQSCKERAINEDLPLSQIYNEECDKDPVAASISSSLNVLTRMKRARRLNKKNHPTDEEEETTSNDALETGPVEEDTAAADIHEGAVPEKIPSLLGDMLWHASGYFYSTTDPFNQSGSVEKLQCVEMKCPALAEVTFGDRGQPLNIRLRDCTAHSHPADLQRRDQLLFMERCKRRAATTLQSVEEIYYDEACRSPEVAAQLSAVRVKKAMGVAKKEKMKKGMRLDEKEGQGDYGDYGMSELGEMAKVQSSTSAGSYREEAVASDDGVQEESDGYLPEEADDDLWMVNPLTLSSEQKSLRKKALAKQRQRRRRSRMTEDPNKREQLEREKEKTRQRALKWQRRKTQKLKEMKEKHREDINRASKMTPLLGPKFLREEFEEEEEFVEDSYSDYVTLEEDSLALEDSCDVAKENEGEEVADDDSQNASEEESTSELVGQTLP